MRIEDTHTVTVDEASYEVTKALLPFLIEAGTPVAIRRDGWLLMVSTSVAGPPYENTKEYSEEAWAKLVDAVMTYGCVTGKPGYSTAIVVPELGTWWVAIEPCH